MSPKNEPVTSPLNWRRPDPEHDEHVRRRAEGLIGEVLERTRGLPEIEILLALGHACIFTSRADRAIWTAEWHRQRQEGN